MDKIFKLEGHQVIATLGGDPNNPPVFFIHGWMSHRGIWQQTIQALESRYYCVGMDLLGYGASDKPANSDYSLPAHAGRLLKLADQLGFSHFSLVGHSMGGQIALYIATILAPQRVDKIVSVSGVVTGRLSDRVERLIYPLVQLGRRFPGVYGLARPLLNFSPFVNFAFQPWFYDMNSLPLEAWAADRNIACNQACAVPNDEARKSIRAINLVKYLHKIKVPNLLIHGEEDGTVPVEQATLARDVIPNNNLALIKKCGHFPMYEKPGQYLKAMALMFQ